MNRTKILFNNKKLLASFLFLSFAYLLLYLYTTGDISFLPSSQKFSVFFLTSWRNVLFKSKSPFIWEAIGVISFGRIYLAISPMNILIGLSISILVSFNLILIHYFHKHPSPCPLGKRSLFGIFTGLLGGFACCVPTFIILLGPAFSSLTIFFIHLRVLLIPFTIVLLTWGLLHGIKKIQ